MADSREFSRRDFLKVAGGSALAFGLLYVSIPHLRGEDAVVDAASPDVVTEWPVVWLATGACTGCVVSSLNSLSPRIQNILLDEVVPLQHVSLRFHTTIMAGEGDRAIEAIKATKEKGGYLLVVEGAISTKDNGVYCQIGEENGQGITALDWTTSLGRAASAVLAVGTCSAYGGIPAADPNPTGCVPVSQVFKDAGVNTPIINIPGCPPHPDWLFGTLADILAFGFDAVKLDEFGRPLDFYGKLIHEKCPRFSYFEGGRFSRKFSDPYCMYQLGCKGPITHADCPTRLWNSGTNWCVGANSLCHGCVEPGFPDKFSPFRRQMEDGKWELEPLPEQQEPKGGFNPVAAGVIGGVAGAAAGAALLGAGLYALNRRSAQNEDEKQEEKAP
jgi:hydrogenase small subunit